QAVGPDHGPRSGSGLARHRGGRFDRLDTVVRHKPERAQDVGILWLVVGVVVAHLGVRRNAGGPATLRRPIGLHNHSHCGSSFLGPSVLGKKAGISYIMPIYQGSVREQYVGEGGRKTKTENAARIVGNA